MSLHEEKEFLNLPFRQKLEFLYGLSARRKRDLILSAPEAPRLVQSFSPETLFYTLKEIGLADAGDLLEMALPEQIKGLVDLDCWDKDRPNLDRIQEWLEALSEAGRSRMAEALIGLDFELVTLLFRRYLKVHRLEEVQQSLDVPVDRIVQFDDHYAVEFIRYDAGSALIQELLEEIFERDYEYFANLMEEIYWGVEAELEEHAYQFRRARLSDRGFPDFFEAQNVFAYLNPRQFEQIKAAHVKCYREGALVEELGLLDYALVSPDQDTSLFNTALSAGFSAAAQHQLRSESALVANQVLAARAVDFGDLEAVQKAIRLTHDYLNVALEHLAGGDLRTAVEHLRDTHLKLLFRLGVSLTIDLRSRAEQLLGILGLSAKVGRDVSYLDSPYREALSGFLRRLPEFYSGLDGTGEITWRAFRRMRDLHIAYRVLQQIEAMPALLRATAEVDIASASFRAQIAGREIRLGQILLTALVRRAMGEKPQPRALSPGELERARAAIVENTYRPGRLKNAFREQIDAMLQAHLEPETLQTSADFVSSCLNLLEEEFGRLNPKEALDPRCVRSVLVRHG
jgi:hypothetical protein